jgi:hypothetical protein
MSTEKKGSFYTNNPNKCRVTSIISKSDFVELEKISIATGYTISQLVKSGIKREIKSGKKKL